MGCLPFVCVFALLLAQFGCDFPCALSILWVPCALVLSRSFSRDDLGRFLRMWCLDFYWPVFGLAPGLFVDPSPSSKTVARCFPRGWCRVPLHDFGPALCLSFDP